MPLIKVKVPIDQRHDKIHQYYLKEENSDGDDKRGSASSFLHKIALHRVENLRVILYNTSYFNTRM
jgi:hypothetical protein